MSEIRLIASKIFKRPNRITEIVVKVLEFVRQDDKSAREFVDEFKKVSNYKQGPPDAPITLNKIACIDDWENLEFKQTLAELFDGKVVTYMHRKHWEWVLGIIAIKRFGLLNNKIKGLAVGAGKEDVLFYLANNINQVYATDLYRGDWEEAPSDFPDNPKKYAPFNYREDGLTALRMDGTRLEFPDETFDFVFSFSSIEHFGGDRHAGSLRSVKEMERVLKKGGIAAIATEYVINGKEHKEFFNNQNLYADLIDHLQMKLIEPLNLELNPTTLDNVLDFYSAVHWTKGDLEYQNRHPHIVIRARNMLHTSIMLVFQK